MKTIILILLACLVMSCVNNVPTKQFVIIEKELYRSDRTFAWYRYVGGNGVTDSFMDGNIYFVGDTIR